MQRAGEVCRNSKTSFRNSSLSAKSAAIGVSGPRAKAAGSCSPLDLCPSGQLENEHWYN